MTFHQIHTNKDYYKYSFFPLTIVQSNALQTNVQFPMSLDRQGNFGLSSLPRLTTIHSSFILFHNPDAWCLPKKSRGHRHYHKIDNNNR